MKELLIALTCWIFGHEVGIESITKNFIEDIKEPGVLIDCSRCRFLHPVKKFTALKK